jgi:UDP-N-acetylglucosamine--N-acetylmuramyl-(pentapeptide) pyrophosphoryl-undecaprenol N-acetylglucosamine transferase
MRTNQYIIAGGGTGGHIYPGVAVAKAIKKMDPLADVYFVGTEQGLESKIIPKEGFQIKFIKVGKLNRAGGLFVQLKTLISIPVAFFQSYQILKNLRPKSVLGVGGYASGPLVLVASFMGIPTAIWEANAHPGLTNRWLSKYVNKVFLVFSDAAKLISAKQIRTVGLPVRDEIIQQKVNIKNNEKFRVLIFGGSQGARAINNTVSEMILNNKFEDIFFVHQTGKLDFHKIQEKYQGLESQVQAHEFLYDMSQQYSQCDLIICRGGASTVAEISACGKVAIIIPLPTAADNHQQINAESLIANGAGTMILQKDLTSQKLRDEILRLKNNPELREQISSNIKKMFIPQAAENMAEEMIGGLV